MPVKINVTKLRLTGLLQSGIHGQLAPIREPSCLVMIY